MLSSSIKKRVTSTAPVARSPFNVVQLPLRVGVASEPGDGEQYNTDSYRLIEVYTPTPEGAVGAVIPVAIVASVVNPGHPSSAVSQRAVETLYAALRRQSDQSIQQRLVAALQQAKQAGRPPTIDDGQPANQEVSMVVAAVWQQTIHLAYSGDCRAYFISNGAIQPLIHTAHQAALYVPITFPPRSPHSLLFPPRRTPVDQQGTRLTPATPDTLALQPPMHQSHTDQLHTYQVAFNTGDTLLLCTPGLYRAVSEQAMRDAVVDQHPQTAAWQLAMQANQAKATASYTALLIQQTESQMQPAISPRRARYGGLLLVCCLLLVIAQLFAFAKESKAPLTIGNQTLISLPIATMAQATPVAAEKAPASPATPLSQPLSDQDHKRSAAATVTNASAVAVATSTPSLVVVERLWTRLALTATISAFSQNFTAALQKAGNAVAAAQTATASAPTPTPTATVTLTPTLPPTPTPTRRPPTPTYTPTALVPLPKRNDFANASVKLLEPAEYDTLTEKRPFRWQANFVLPPGYAFEVVFWQHDQDPLKQGKGYAGLTTTTQINASYEHFRIRDGAEGEYHWGVLLVRPKPYQRVKYLGGGRLIYVKQQ